MSPFATKVYEINTPPALLDLDKSGFLGRISIIAMDDAAARRQRMLQQIRRFHPRQHPWRWHPCRERSFGEIRHSCRRQRPGPLPESLGSVIRADKGDGQRPKNNQEYQRRRHARSCRRNRMAVFVVRLEVTTGKKVLPSTLQQLAKQLSSRNLVHAWESTSTRFRNI